MRATSRKTRGIWPVVLLASAAACSPGAGCDPTVAPVDPTQTTAATVQYAPAEPAPQMATASAQATVTVTARATDEDDFRQASASSAYTPTYSVIRRGDSPPVAQTQPSAPPPATAPVAAPPPPPESAPPPPPVANDTVVVVPGDGVPVPEPRPVAPRAPLNGGPAYETTPLPKSAGIPLYPTPPTPRPIH